MSALAFMAAALLLAAVSTACFKVGNWHSREADYWNDVAWKVRLNPTADQHFRPILRWAQSHRPSLMQRLLPWAPPDERMNEAAS